jgi:hypothetical protein
VARRTKLKRYNLLKKKSNNKDLEINNRESPNLIQLRSTDPKFKTNLLLKHNKIKSKIRLLMNRIQNKFNLRVIEDLDESIILKIRNKQKMRKNNRFKREDSNKE